MAVLSQRMARKLKVTLVTVTVLFLFQRISLNLLGSYVLPGSETETTWKNWKPSVHLLTAAMNLHDIMPMYISRRALPKQDSTLILFSSECPLFPQHLDTSSGYSYNRNSVDFFSTLLAGTFSHVVWVYPFIHDPVQTDLPATTEYSIGTSRFFIPLSPSSTGSKGENRSVHFHTICLCDSGQQHCSLPHLSHLAGPIPIELCNIQHKFAFSHLFDFVLESNLMTSWLKSTSDTFDPVHLVVFIEMTYFGKRYNRITENAQLLLDSTSSRQGDDEWKVQSKDVLWGDNLLSRLLQLYTGLVLTDKSRTPLYVTRSLLDLAYLLLSPSFLFLKTVNELSAESDLPTLCGSSPETSLKWNASRLLHDPPDGANASRVPSYCAPGFHLLLQFVHLTEPSLVVDEKTRQALSRLWLWLCSHNHSSGVHRQQMTWLSTVCQTPGSRELVLCPRRMSVSANPDRGTTDDQIGLQLLLHRLGSLFRRMPRPRLVVINSEELAQADLTEEHLSLRVCRMVNSVLRHDLTPAS